MFSNLSVLLLRNQMPFRFLSLSMWTLISLWKFNFSSLFYILWNFTVMCVREFFFFCLMLGTWWAFSIENSYPFSLVLLFKNNFLSFVLCSVFVKLLVVGCWCPGLTRKHFLKTFVFPVFHCLVSFCSTSWTVLSNSVSSKNFYLPVVFLKVVFCSDH